MTENVPLTDSRRLTRLAGTVLLLNVLLMLVKLVVGYVGNSYALIADGIESASDIFVSFITWGGFFLSLRPADKDHPFGHGKLESLAGMVSGGFLLLAAVGIAIFSIREILTPHHAPAWYTLPVLLLVVIAKESMAKKILAQASGDLDSRALEGDAWHHRSDAITSGAAAVGIGVALIGGEGWEMADDWGALLACIVIVANGIRIFKISLHDILDGRVDNDIVSALRVEAERDTNIYCVEKCRLRKSGIGYFAEIHLEVDESMTVRVAHALGHSVKDRLQEVFPRLIDIVVHVEPHDGSTSADSKAQE